jgi:transposase
MQSSPTTYTIRYAVGQKQSGLFLMMSLPFDRDEYLDIGDLVMKVPDGDKTKFLAAHRMLHPHPERVRDMQFQSERFLDARDLVQVRYEMLRRHLVGGQSVTKVTQAFGVSRQMFYNLLKTFRKKGLYGLLPRKRGPPSPHLREAFVITAIASEQKKIPERSISKRLMDVQKKHGLRIHAQTREYRHTRHRKSPA